MVLELSLREALQIGHNYIGTEHMLLGLSVKGRAWRHECCLTWGPTFNEPARRSSSAYPPQVRSTSASTLP